MVDYYLPDEFHGKIVLVTGGSRGIGREIVLAFAALGSRVFFAYRSNHEAAENVCALGKSRNGEVTALQTDVSFSETAQKLIEAVIREHGRIDILVNNAGEFQEKPVVEITDGEWETALRINLNSTFFCSRAALPAMIASQQGTIINIASIAGKRGSMNHAAYAAAKGAILAFSRSLAMEVIEHKIRVNAVCPGRVNTDLLAPYGKSDLNRWLDDTPIRRLGSPCEIAHVVVFLASQRASYIVGETIDVDGGVLMD
jgi:3-oxoacyl-[acyl-carrier protein] reductase